jgi:hypothetical protein
LSGLASFLGLYSLLASSSFAQVLRPSDISILWPLKSAPSQDAASDLVFKMKGDGLCNTPKVADWNLVFKETFALFQKEALNKVGDQCTRDQELEDKYFFHADADLMQGDIHLSLLKGIHPFACQENNWRITAVRFDPCVNSSETLDKKKKCDSELRLIAQLIETSDSGINAVRDFTVHMIYEVTRSRVAEVVKDLKELARVSRASEAQTPWEPEFDAKSILRPHHGLRNEMDSCGGPVTSAMKGFLAKNATPEKLTQLAWMTSSMGVKEWSFGLLEVTEQGKKVELKKINDQFYDNFSDVLMMTEVPALNKEFFGGKFGSIYDELFLVAGAKVPPSEQGAEKLKQHFSRTTDLLNPNKTAQVQPLGCTSCHLAHQTLSRLEDMYATKAPKADLYDAPVWPGFLAEKRSFTQLRNFGYGPQFSLAINVRSINETDFAAKLLEKEFP